MQPATLIPLCAAVGLAACGPAPMPAAGGIGAGQARTGGQVVDMGGTLYQASLMADGPGAALTAAGAVAVPGMMVSVTGLARDQGKLAKDIATRACAQAGGRPQGQALGAYASGQWNFAGGCA